MPLEHIYGTNKSWENCRAHPNGTDFLSDVTKYREPFKTIRHNMISWWNFAHCDKQTSLNIIAWAPTPKKKQTKKAIVCASIGLVSWSSICVLPHRCVQFPQGYSDWASTWNIHERQSVFFIAHGQFNGCLNGNQPGTLISQLYFQQGFIRIRYDSSKSTVPHQEHGKTNGVTIVSLPSPKQWPMINNDGF